MTGKRAISTVNRSSELICHWVDLWCAIDFVNLILFRLLSNGFGVLISRFESQWNMNGSSSSFMFMLKLENTYVSPATGFSSLRAEIGQEKRFFVILKAENFITRDLNGNHLWTHFMRLYTINEICVMDFDHDRFWTKKWLMFSLSVNEIAALVAASLLEMEKKHTHNDLLITIRKSRSLLFWRMQHAAALHALAAIRDYIQHEPKIEDELQH